jgi:NTP pyrophosphatase (non-canonical NTP hydrolase)
VLKSECFPSLLRILSEQVEFDIHQKLKENAEKGYRLIADPEVMAHFFTGAILETLQWWLTHKKSISLESVERQIVDMMKAVYLSANADI